MRNQLLAIALAATFSVPTLSFSQTELPKKATAYMVADAHLDTQWNWDIKQTINHYVKNTLWQNLFLLKKYPDYVFNFEGGIKYYWMKEYYPDQYEELKKYIKEGRWHIAGSSWEASDILVASPESSIRSIMYGQNFYRKEFGREGTDIFLPDCFGFGWTLPTIAAHCGLIGFSSQKLQWRNHPFYPGNKTYPFTVGLWKGIDGSIIMMAHGFDYGKKWNDEDLSNNKTLIDEAAQSSLNTVMRYYGTGDIGGSPNLASVRSVEKGLKGNGPVRIISATSDQLFKQYLPYSAHPELPLFDGELLMDVHGTGCYTSQAVMKLYNRQNEQLGDAAERAAVVADWMGQNRYPADILSSAWKRFIFHQFHDDLTGTSIPRAYEFSWNDELISLNQFAHVLTSSVNGIAERMDTRTAGSPLVIYNSHAYPVQDLVEVVIPKADKGFKVVDDKGVSVASQVVASDDDKIHLLIDAHIPATGCSVYSIQSNAKTKQQSQQSSSILENSIYKITLDKNGDICSLFDKKNNKELVETGKAIRLALFTDDKSYNWPAWEIIKSTVDATPISIIDNIKISTVDEGNLCKSLCITKRYGDSQFKQYIRLYEGSRANRIDFYNEVDWQTPHTLLKAEFPLSISNPMATYDLGIGSVQRDNNTETKYEVYAQQWADLTNLDNSYGVTVLNDCKYGWDKPDDHTLRLSLLHTPAVKNNYVYQARQDFGHHTFIYSLIGHADRLDKAQATMQGELLNQPLRGFLSEKHQGDLGKTFSFVSSDNKNVVVKALKKAENSDEYTIRVYEVSGSSPQKAQITFAGNIEKACEADGTEKEIGSASFEGNKLNIEIGKFGVKAFKVSLKRPGVVSEKQVAYMDLPYDRRCFSYNAFRNEGNFEAGHSYAAELLPDSILTVDGIPFRLGEKDAASGLTCKGNVIKLPVGRKYNRLYFLAASTKDDVEATFAVGKNRNTVTVPNYTGFIGQWEHIGHTKGFLKDAEVAYVGTHRHSANSDEAYDFTYMFKFGFDIPKGATEIVLPDDNRVVLFAATLAVENAPQVRPASSLYRTSLLPSGASMKSAKKENLMRRATVLSYSGQVNDKEQAKFAIDGDETTKWCDISLNPNYIVFDLHQPCEVSGWRLVNAGCEDMSCITRSCFLQGRNSDTEEWTTLDELDGNESNIVERQFNAQKVRYIRLLVTNPTQEKGSSPSRIYELEVY